jgi:hypothetical protein
VIGMAKIRIKKMDPLPDGRLGPRVEHTKALLALEPGEGFSRDIALLRTIASLCTTYGQKLGRKFETRQVGEQVIVRRLS